MKYQQPPARRASDKGGVVGEQFLEVLRDEQQTVEELLGVIDAQRAAVEADDLEGLDLAVFATRRLAACLQDSRKCRQQLYTLIGLPADSTTSRVKAQLGEHWTEEHEHLHVRLTEDAGTLWSALEGQQVVLQKLVTDTKVMGERLQANESGIYRPAGTKTRGGALVDRVG